MPLIQLMQQATNVPYSKRKEDLAEEIAAKILQECPGAALLNTSTLRSFIFDLLDYNKQPETSCTQPYTICRASTVSVPVNGQKLIITTTKDNAIYKVCPSCKMTANIGDPICPNCNHIYNSHELEETVVATAIADACNKLGVELSAANKQDVVLNDAVEGFRVTEGDIDRYLREIEKYRPSV